MTRARNGCYNFIIYVNSRPGTRRARPLPYLDGRSALPMARKPSQTEGVGRSTPTSVRIRGTVPLMSEDDHYIIGYLDRFWNGDS
jgi:hypothetical protein